MHTEAFGNRSSRPTTKLTGVTLTNITFKKCNCGIHDGMPHGHFFKGEPGSKLRVAVVSLAAGRYIMEKLPNFKDQDKVQLEQDILAAGIPERVEGDVEATKRMLGSALETAEVVVMLSIVSMLADALEQDANYERLRQQAEMN